MLHISIACVDYRSLLLGPVRIFHRAVLFRIIKKVVIFALIIFQISSVNWSEDLVDNSRRKVRHDKDSCDGSTSDDQRIHQNGDKN